MAKPDNTSQPQQTRNWYKDRYETALTQRNFLGAMAAMSLLLAIIATLVIFVLIPSKTVLPFLIQVDEKTGITQTIDPKSQREIVADEALRKYFVVKFVTARESYNTTLLDQYNETVRLMSNRSIFSQYRAEVTSSSNRDSYIVQLAGNQVRQIDIKSVQFLDANRAQVRFSAIIEDKQSGRARGEPENFVALVKFRFANLDLNLNEMLINPLGFVVEEYRLDEDALI